MGTGHSNWFLAVWLLQAPDEKLALQFGGIYARGVGVPRNAAVAVRWYERAAASGSAVAANTLGVAYLKGEGVPRNIELDFAWFTRAADQGNADSLIICGPHVTPHHPPAACSQRQISTAPYFQRPGAKLLWKGDLFD